MGFLLGIIVVCLAFSIIGRLIQNTGAAAAGSIATAQIIYDVLSPEARAQVDAAAAQRQLQRLAMEQAKQQAKRRAHKELAIFLACIFGVLAVVATLISLMDWISQLSPIEASFWLMAVLSSVVIIWLLSQWKRESTGETKLLKDASARRDDMPARQAEDQRN